MVRGRVRRLGRSWGFYGRLRGRQGLPEYFEFGAGGVSFLRHPRQALADRTVLARQRFDALAAGRQFDREGFELTTDGD